jgi:hypothetical protein
MDVGPAITAVDRGYARLTRVDIRGFVIALMANRAARLDWIGEIDHETHALAIFRTGDRRQRRSAGVTTPGDRRRVHGIAPGWLVMAISRRVIVGLSMIVGLSAIVGAGGARLRVARGTDAELQTNPREGQQEDQADGNDSRSVVRQ